MSANIAVNTRTTSTTAGIIGQRRKNDQTCIGKYKGLLLVVVDVIWVDSMTISVHLVVANPRVDDSVKDVGK